MQARELFHDTQQENRQTEAVAPEVLQTLRQTHRT